MKILLAITKAEIGGAQTFILTLARGLKAAQQEVVVAAGEGDFLPEELAKNGIEFICLKSLKRSYNPLQIFSFIKELRKILAQGNFQVVHFNSTNTLPGALAARLGQKKVRTIFTVHGLSVLDPNYQAPRLVKILFKLYFQCFLKFIDKSVFVSRYNLEEAKKQGVATQGSVIYNGLELQNGDFLSREEARRELGKIVGEDFFSAYLIGSVGRLAYPKNYEFLINLWTEIKKNKPAAKLIIIGEGPERKKYEEMIKQQNLSADIFLAGERIDARKLLKGLDLFVLPSIYEGLSISLIEALSAKTPSLASAVGGNSEIIGADNCFVLDSDSFISRLKRGFIQTDVSNNFIAQEMVDRYLKEYEV